jgi:AcrR family transcriptional regulator
MDQISPPSMDARRVRSRKALRKALLALLEKKPFDQITIREITATADVGYATFFRHFATKDDLLNELAAGRIRTLLELSSDLLMDDESLVAARALCTYVDEHRALWTALLTGGAAGTIREEFIRQTCKIAGESIHGSGHFWLPGNLAVVYGAGSTIDVLAWWLSQESHHSIDEMAKVLDELVMKPILRGTVMDRSTLPESV